MFLSLKQFFVICFVLLKTVSGTPVKFSATDNRVYIVEISPQYNWIQAYFWCARNGAKLADIESKEKNDVIAELLKKQLGKSSDFWVAANDELNTTGGTGRRFFWSTTGKRMAYSYWSTGNPSNNGGNEHCVYMTPSFKWSAASCTLKKGFICECLSNKCRKAARC